MLLKKYKSHHLDRFITAVFIQLLFARRQQSFHC